MTVSPSEIGFCFISELKNRSYSSFLVNSYSGCFQNRHNSHLFALRHGTMFMGLH